MAQAGQRKCLCCGDFFDPDHRNRERQRFCAASDCRRASQAASQAAWLAKPQNKDYFRDRLHVARVQAWRVAHPGYGRGTLRKVRSRPALQEALIAQALDLIEESSIRGEIAAVPALQEALESPSPLLTGLIAHLFEVTLQEDIAAATRRLVQLGHDVIHRAVHRSDRHEEGETGSAARAATPSAGAVQLG